MREKEGGVEEKLRKVHSLNDETWSSHANSDDDILLSEEAEIVLVSSSEVSSSSFLSLLPHQNIFKYY